MNVRNEEEKLRNRKIQNTGTIIGTLILLSNSSVTRYSTTSKINRFVWNYLFWLNKCFRESIRLSKQNKAKHKMIFLNTTLQLFLIIFARFISQVTSVFVFLHPKPFRSITLKKKKKTVFLCSEFPFKYSNQSPNPKLLSNFKLI